MNNYILINKSYFKGTSYTFLPLMLPPNASGQVYILRHDCYTLGMYCTQISVLKEGD